MRSGNASGEFAFRSCGVVGVADALFFGFNENCGTVIEVAKVDDGRISPFSAISSACYYASEADSERGGLPSF